MGRSQDLDSQAAGGGPEKAVTQEGWKRAKDLFSSALVLPETEREAFLSAQQDEREILDEVRSLLEAYRDSPDFLENATPELPAEFRESAASLAGRRIGVWELVREIGQGGMGVVYLAERDDGEYRQQAALKVLKPGPQRDLLLGLFRRERQILAQLQHPNIARLMDGGTADGQVFYVMEYVAGSPLTAYCNANRFTIQQRLKLFCEICDAVSYAHRKLIIHRDLKPENILVTADGAPKLLDFGLAKVFEDSSGAETAASITIGPMLTPSYASPEQVRGEHLSTATDIYSLGVVLYELLTGRNPQAQASQSPMAVCRTILEEEPPPPSRATENRRDRGLAGDLDNIVLKALRKESERRYASVGDLRADVERYLEGFPVEASRDTLSYRARKFVSRNRAAVAAVALAMLSLFIGLGVSVREAHVAQVQRARAERHFNDVRKLANSLLFEIDDKIRDLPGATDARRLMVARAGEYLDYLAGEAAGDTKLNLELADAYARLGQVQGNPSFPNLGDRSGALASYEKSSRIAEDVLRREPDNAKALQVVANSMSAQGWLMVTANRPVDAVATLQKAVDASQALVRLYPQETSYLQQLAEQLNDLGDMMGNPWFPGLGDIDGAERCYSLSLETWSESLAHQSPTPEMQQKLVRLYYSLSLLQWEGRGRSAPAREWVEKALEKMKDLPPAQRDQAAESSRMGALYAADGEADSARSPRLATVEYKRSLGYERQLKAADPRNTKADEDLSWALVLYGAFLSRVPARHGEALAALQEAVNLGSLMPSEELGDTKEEGEAEVRIGQLLMQQGQTDEARKRSLAGLAIMRRLAEPADAAPLFRGLYAWALLHAEPRDLRSPETALLHAQAASDAAHGRDVKYLDLLAEAYNQAGHAQQAVTLERQVLALLPDPADRVDYERNLNRFQAALHKAPHK